MSSKKKRRFKVKRRLGRFLIIPEMEGWNSKPFARVYSVQIPTMRKLRFEETMLQVLHYRLMQLFFFEFDRAMRQRTSLFVNKIHDDIFFLRRLGTFQIEARGLGDLRKKILLEIESVTSKLWSNPEILYPKGRTYQTTFEYIAKLSRGDSTFRKKSLRDEIKYTFYNSAERVKMMFDRRYPKESARKEYYDFMVDNIFSNLILSNFLMGGKLKRAKSRATFDPQKYEFTRQRFMNGYKKKPQ